MIRAEINNATKTPISKARLEEAIRATNKILKKKKDYRISIAFVSEKRIASYNRRYRKKSVPTDVLSFSGLGKNVFPAPGKGIWAGEIIICPAIAKKNARFAGITMTREIQNLLIHGLLHIFGYEHGTTAKEKKMSALQEKIISSI